MNTTLYIVRHGTTYQNLDHIFQGTIDGLLTEDGLKQADELGEYFKDIPVDAAYVSPLQRSGRTMQGLLKYHPDVKPVVIDDLIEIYGGVLQGLNFDECNSQYNNIMNVFETHPEKFQAPGGESVQDVYRRVTNAVMNLVRENPGKTIVIVSHGTAIQTWLSYAAGIPAEQVKFQFLPNGAVSKYTIDNSMNIQTDFVGYTSYMKDEPVRLF